MKILLLGKNGMLGSQFESQLASAGVGVGQRLEVFGFDRDKLDVTKFGELEAVFHDVRPDIVINCAAYTDVDEAEFQKKKAFALNAEAVRDIARLCDKGGSVLVHFSTDYVFDGHREVPSGYREDDMPNPLNVYGESKFRGEEFVQKEMARFFIVRTSWLHGPRPSGGGSFVDTMLRLGNEVLSGERPELKVVGDQFGSPTYAKDLAEAVIKSFVLPRDSSCDLPCDLPEFGIYHLVGGGFCSWYEFAVRIFELAGMKVPVKKISSAEYQTAAQRPKNSILMNTGLPRLRDWDEALADYLSLQN